MDLNTICDHHVHYKELDGYDEIIKMKVGRHTKFHKLNPKFLVPENTKKIGAKNYQKYFKHKYLPSILLEKGVYLQPHIRYNIKTNHITITAGLKCRLS